MWKIFLLSRLTFAFATSVLLLVSSQPAMAQSEPLTVCQLLNLPLDHREVTLVAYVTGGPHHGFYLVEGAGSDPCPGWRRQLFTAPSAMTILLGSTDGIEVPKVQEQANLDFVGRLRSLSSGRHLQPYKVIVTGVLVRKPWPLMFRRADGTYSTIGGRSDGEDIARFVLTSVHAEGN